MNTNMSVEAERHHETNEVLAIRRNIAMNNISRSTLDQMLRETIAEWPDAICPEFADDIEPDHQVAYGNRLWTIDRISCGERFLGERGELAFYDIHAHNTSEPLDPNELKGT